ncbi:hypothetical protein AWB68_07562 [Caballeronia choica]|uniref:Uncharacterized protein n=1 Tax=Caballeronia choica TaxID=326476 RepID=A0A158KVB9_9BURK|nr:hypothetical protein [Caballeronia choica]SAL85098.1 hypothetical protein AWB68_07562 [Caballeronia choica]
MAQDFADGDDEFAEFSDAAVARVVLALDQAITRRRQLAAATVNAKLRIVLGTWVPPPLKPTRIELAVFTVLAQTYGPAVLHHPDFTPVLEDLAECGAVVLVQRALWGEQLDDVRLAARLLDARIPFEILCGTWPEVFMAQAHAELQGFRPQPPKSPKSPMASDGEEGGDD